MTVTVYQGWDCIYPEFEPGGRLFASFDAHVKRYVGLPSTRAGGRIFFPGDCIYFKTGYTVIEVFHPDEIDLAIGPANRLKFMCDASTAGAGFTVLSAFRDDQPPDDQPPDDNHDPYPLVTMLALTPRGIGWIFVHIMRDCFIDVVPAPGTVVRT